MRSDSFEIRRHEAKAEAKAAQISATNITESHRWIEMFKQEKLW